VDLIAALQTLGLPIGADAAAVKAAFRRLISFYHPDRNRSPEAVPRSQEINRAFHVLEQAGFPTNIDHYRSTFEYREDRDTRQEPTADDPFSSYYEDFRRPQARRGRTIRRKVKLTIEEAARGTTVQLSGSVKDNCESCAGRGWTREFECRSCYGEGYVYRGKGGNYGWYGERRVRCEACSGRGMERTTCAACFGTGNQRLSRKYARTIRIPPGVLNGDELVIRGAGGRSTAEAGDFNIEIELKPHEFFRFDADGYLSCIVPLHILQFLAQDEVVVPTLWGDRVVRPQPPTRIVEIPTAGFPGRRGERFPLRVLFNVVEAPLLEPHLSMVQDLWKRLNRSAMPRHQEVERWMEAVRTWKKRLGRDSS
jgi:molecular chaperone DnaJ